MSSFTNLFGNGPIKPSQVQFEAIALAANTTLFWPTETQAGQTYVAAQMNVTPATTGLSLIMPDARQGSTGVATLIVNVGTPSFNLTTNTGVLIATIAAGLSWVISLTDNTTQSGVWQAIQLGATTSSAQASALAGGGLQAIATKLQVYDPPVFLSASTPIVSTFRANSVVWNGTTAGVLQLASVASLTSGWWCLFTNEGTLDITITTTGPDTINGGSSYTLPQNTGTGEYYSALVVCSSTGFHVFGAVPSPIPVTGGGTGANNADDALANLGGSAIGITIFTAPNAAAVLAALGITNNVITEMTIAVNTPVQSGSSGLAYHCSAPLTLTLVANSGLTKSFFFLVDAHGGAVTIQPDAADAINGQVAGSAYIMASGSSLLMTTDAAGNWWPFANGGGGSAGGIPWAIAGGTADVITAAYTPTINALSDGLLLAVRFSAANATPTPTYSPDGLTAHPITKWGGTQLAIGDIGGALAEGLLRYNLTNTRWELLNPVSPAHVPQVFAGSGTYTTAPDTTVNTVIEFTVIGGGGGGGGAATNPGAAGAGGASGGIAVAAFKGFGPNQPVAIVVGAAGTAGVNTGGNGGTGGTSTVAYAAVTFFSVTGGTGGTGKTTAAAAVGGITGTGSISLGASGLTTVYSSLLGGAPGGFVLVTQIPGYGGGSSYGAGAPCVGLGVESAGSAGSAMGGGGSGASRAAADHAGGVGGAGGVIVKVVGQ